MMENTPPPPIPAYWDSKQKDEAAKVLSFMRANPECQWVQKLTSESKATFRVALGYANLGGEAKFPEQWLLDSHVPKHAFDYLSRTFKRFQAATTTGKQSAGSFHDTQARAIGDSESDNVFWRSKVESGAVEVHASTGRRYYEIKALIDKRGKGRRQEYLTRWRGFDKEFDDWQPRKTLVQTVSSLVEDFDKKIANSQRCKRVCLEVSGKTANTL